MVYNVWGFDRSSEGKIIERPSIQKAAGNDFTVILPPLSAFHVLLSSKQ
jgi:hypothetical protein